MTHSVNAEVKNNVINPDCPAPTPQQEDCVGTGTIQGTVTLNMPCCCPRLYTRTFVIRLNPSDIPTLEGNIASTVNAWEAAGYLVLGHSLTDVGGGWLINLTIGWYM